MPNCRTPPPGLGLSNPQNRPWPIVAPHQLGHQFVLVLGEPEPQVLDGQPVRPRRPLVRLHTLLGLVQVGGGRHPFHQVLPQGSLLLHRPKCMWLRAGPSSGSAVAGSLLGIVPRGEEISLGKTLIFPPRIFPPGAAGFTRAMSERRSGLAIHCWLTPSHRPAIRFLFVRSGFRLRLPPHPASRRRRCLQLTIPVVAARRDLPSPKSVSCQAHNARAAPIKSDRL